jgi:VWFA-related protein
MFLSRTLPGTTLAILLLCFCVSTVRGASFDFLAPSTGTVVIGPTEFLFAINSPDLKIDRIDVFGGGRLIGTATEPAWSFHADVPEDLAGAKIVAVGYANGKLVEKVQLSTPEILGQRVDVLAVQLYPVVLDGHKYAGYLGKSDFLVFDNGHLVEIESFSKEALSLTIAIVLDTSSSMADNLALVQESSYRFLDQLKADDQVAVYGFSHKITKTIPPTTDRQAAKEAIRQLIAAGGTAMYDALGQVLTDIKPISGRKAIVLFSDGRDQRSLLSLSRVAQLAQEADVIIYTIGAGDDKEDLQARNDLKLLAEDTGGEPHFLDSLKGLSRAYGDIFDDLRAQYSISYRPEAGPPGMRTVEVRLRDSKLKVRCKKRYRYDPNKS